MTKRKIGAALLLVVLMALLASVAYAACPGAHSYGSYSTKYAATCQHPGLKFRYCRNCDHWEKREIPKLPHEIAEWIITREPTCTQKGMKKGYCTSCEQDVFHYVDIIPHAYGEPVVVKEPTCTQSGRAESTCAGCGRVKAETLPKLGHDWVATKIVKEPTCLAQGKGEETCQRCARVREGSLAKLEHVFGEWNVLQEPEGRSKGKREHTCTLCGTVESERFFWDGTLYEDMKPCEEVIEMQQMLTDLGFYKGSIRTGTFGPVTGKAVAKFQTAHGLEATQIADPETLELIRSEWEKAFGPADAEATPGEAAPAVEG